MIQIRRTGKDTMQRTSPTQAASARSVDRWQLIVGLALEDLQARDYRGAMLRLQALQKSMQRTERR